MNELKVAAKEDGKNMTVFGAITIILGILAMMAPGLTGISVAILVGVIVLVGGIVRIIWAFQAGSLGKGLLMFTIGILPGIKLFFVGLIRVTGGSVVRSMAKKKEKAERETKGILQQKN